LHEFASDPRSSARSQSTKFVKRLFRAEIR
jgi:hypothetical protein